MADQREMTLKLFGSQIDRVQVALLRQRNDLEKFAKNAEQRGVDSNARQVVAELEEIIQAMQPQVDLFEKVRPPESYDTPSAE